MVVLSDSLMYLRQATAADDVRCCLARDETESIAGRI